VVEAILAKRTQIVADISSHWLINDANSAARLCGEPPWSSAVIE
jgi:hypothetical protein